MIRVLPNLFIGSIIDTINLQLLMKNNINAIITLTNENIYPDKFKYLCINCPNNNLYKIRKHFQDTNRFIQNNNKTIIQCLDGTSCSTTIAIAYIMTFYRHDYDKILNYITQLDKKAIPNNGFEMQLRNLQSNLHIPQKTSFSNFFYPLENNNIILTSHHVINDNNFIQNKQIKFIISIGLGLKPINSPTKHKHFNLLNKTTKNSINKYIKHFTNKKQKILLYSYGNSNIQLALLINYLVNIQKQSCNFVIKKLIEMKYPKKQILKSYKLLT
jgi:hypothetical protein